MRSRRTARSRRRRDGRCALRPPVMPGRFAAAAPAACAFGERLAAIRRCRCTPRPSARACAGTPGHEDLRRLVEDAACRATARTGGRTASSRPPSARGRRRPIVRRRATEPSRSRACRATATRRRPRVPVITVAGITWMPARRGRFGGGAVRRRRACRRSARPSRRPLQGRRAAAIAGRRRP